MNFQTDKIEGRREFLKKCTRTVVLGGIVLLGGFIGLRRSEGENSTSACAVNLPCRECARFSGCKESRAQIFKKKAESSLRLEK